jgi:hypothetical protein
MQGLQGKKQSLESIARQSLTGCIFSWTSSMKWIFTNQE